MRDNRVRRIPVRGTYECLLGPSRPASRLYFDNASTSFPKPRCVTDAMVDFAVNVGASAGRSAYREAHMAGEILFRCRRNLAQLLHAEAPERIVLAMNCSEALSMVIHGLLSTAPPGAEVVVTALEHNSVLRPLGTLQRVNGLRIHVVPCDPSTGLIDPDDVHRAITSKTRMVVCCHTSNVIGTIQPVAEVCRVAREAGVPCLVDAAQAIGRVEIDVRALGCDFLAFSGHKGLLGPLGTGGLYIRPDAERLLATTREGGTGSQSELTFQPETMPEKFEIGSHNVIGIAGLTAATGWLLKRGVSAIREHDKQLSRVFISSTAGARLHAARQGNVSRLVVYGTRDVERRVGVFSVNVEGMPPGELAAAMETHGILTRSGLHGAPLAHQAIGVCPAPAGTCRLSFGPFMREDHVRRAAFALSQIAEGGPLVRAGVRVDEADGMPEDLTP